MKRSFLLPSLAVAAAFALLSAASTVDPPPDDPDALLKRAEAHHAEGSYAMAAEIYRSLLAGEPANRWLEFRLADATWRAQAATATSDPTVLDGARESLERMVRDVERSEDQDEIWVEIQESLGDYWWTRRDSRNWGQGWIHYERCLAWWARSADIDRARERYIGIVRKAARPPQVEPYYTYGSYGNQIPLPILENVLEIAVAPGDRAHAHYLIAMTLRYQVSDRRTHDRVLESFRVAVDAGPSSDWLDDALFQQAEWLAQSGRAIVTQGGGFSLKPDYPAALAAYRRLVSTLGKGETRYHDQAVSRIEEITAPSVGVAITEFFLPRSEIRYHLAWRNVGKVDLSLRGVDLSRDVSFAGDSGGADWLERLDARGGRLARMWSHDTEDAGEHDPGQATLRIDHLPSGAYLLEARAGGETARDLVLVSRASLVVKSARTRAILFVCDAIDGSPRPGARTTLWVRYHAGGDWHWTTLSGPTGEDGIAAFELPRGDGGVELFAAAADGDHQAYSSGHGMREGRSGERWKVYAFTDRPAYRPGEEIRWKIVARSHDGSTYSTPSDEPIRYEIHDPRGASVEKGESRLNRFGSAWGEMTLGAAHPLGEYRVTFRDGDDRTIGQATLFRLEEYKLPEFRVEVETPSEDGKRATFRAGDTVRARIIASYYFGGRVAGADVEVLVHQRPLWVIYHPRRDYPWYYEDIDARATYPWGGPGQIVHSERLRTGADGEAAIRFDTPRDAGQDFEYTIEARVTDASRREVASSATVKVGRQSYYVFPRSEHAIHSPGDTARITIATLDAGDRPVAASGRVTVTRDRWVETEAFRGYESEEVLSRTVATREDEPAEVTFTPGRIGYYRIAWYSEEEDGVPIRGETTIWVAEPGTTEIGYHPGGVQIIVDKETFRAGGIAPVMITAPFSGAHVLFSVEGDDLYSHRVVHLSGTAKLVELAIDDTHIPNIFLEAAMVRDGNIFVDSRQVIVPPVAKFIDVEMTADLDGYQPREEGIVTITTRDAGGRPVSAEVSLGLVDESVHAIQGDYAMDPRQFFYGTKRSRLVGTWSSFHQRRYATLVEGDDGLLVDERRIAGGKEEDKDLFRDELEKKTAVAEMGAVSLARQSGLAARLDAGNVLQEPMAAAPAEGGLITGPAVEVRSDFRSTAFWQPDIVTGEDGTATARITYPDSLTTWRATARAATAGDRFGIGDAQVVTSKPLIARLQAPRFFVVGDELLVSAVINNNTDSALRVTPEIEAAGLVMLGGTGPAPVVVEAGGEARIDWPVAAREPGTAVLTVTARGGGHSDAMRRDYPVHEHGVEKLLYTAGVARSGDALARLTLPAGRRGGSTRMTVQVSPSLAVTMLDALPYLIDYPYGCTEQTMSRFLPAAITARTLEKLGVRPRDLAGRLFGGIEPASAGPTHPGGSRDLAKLDEMIEQGLTRLYDFQHEDGGWGWWKDGESDHFMTAYVVWGMGLARDAGIRVRDQALQRGERFLDQELVEQEDHPDMQAWMLHALSSLNATARRQPASRFQKTAYDGLWSRRDSLNAYTRALLALSAHHFGDAERSAILVRNMANGATRGDGTAHWGADGIHHRWSEGGVEATAFSLRALLAIDPGNDLVAPVMSWLVKNRRGAQWSSTRDTAVTILTLTDYLETSGELESEISYEVLVNGRRVASGDVRRGDAIGPPSRFEVDPSFLRDGPNEVRVVRTSGDGPIYHAAEIRFFSLEEPVTPAANEIAVTRSYHRLVGRPTLLEGLSYEKRALGDGGSAVSGERIEVVLTIESKNDTEYLVFEDLKPAGLEAVRLRSGDPTYIRELTSPGAGRDPASREPEDYTGRSRWVHQELRDRTVALFVDKLPEGVWEIRYDLRAEIPGTFHALPVLGHAMYVPEIRCNGSELRMTVEDR